MKRSISGMEAAQAELVYGGAVWPGPWTRWRAVPAIEQLPNRDAFRLWRSLDGYRKACRMLRRSGRRIDTAEKKRFRRVIASTLGARAGWGSH